MKYLYNVNFNIYDEALCYFEMRTIFEKSIREKAFFSDIAISPSISTFIKNRIEIIHQTDSFEKLLKWLEAVSYKDEGFMVKYIPIVNRGYNENAGKKMSKEIGMRINGFPDFENPRILYGIAEYNDTFFFGYLKQNGLGWRARKHKPYTFSSALNIHTANALVNIACKGKLNKKVVDPCCGIGTVLIEALAQGISIEGYEINDNVAQLARKNIESLNYEGLVHTKDMNDIEKYYDVAIVDLPYNNFSRIDDNDQLNIIKQSRQIAKEVVIVASEDISEILDEVGFLIIDSCKSVKTIKREFGRYIYLCKSENKTSLK